MKKLISIFLGLLLSQWSWGQALVLKPEFPTADGEVTLTFDLTQAKDSRKAALMNQASGLYIWAWGGSDVSNRTSEFGPAGQSSFSQAYAPGLLTRVSDNVWTIKITPSKYLSVPAGKTLRWMGVLVKNSNGSGQTEDFLFNFYTSNQLFVRFSTPTEKTLFVDANASLRVRASASTSAQLTLTLDGVAVASAKDTAISTSISVGNTPNQRRTVKVTASANNQEVTDEFSFTVSPTPKVAALPSGVRNGINYTSATTATLVLFAPNKKFIYVTGDFNNWETRTDFLMNKTPDGQTYWLEIKDLTPQKEYAFQYLVDGVTPISDPYSEKILDAANDKFIPATTYPNLMAFPAKALGNSASVLQTAQIPYVWKTTNFKRPANEDLVIYELLVRDFVDSRWYKTVGDSLNYLKKLGVNAIELMPVMEFAGNDSWGYNPIFHAAPDKAYGTREDLKAFIDKCHENGIAVILDMVLNQADYEFPYVKMYWEGNRPSADNPMFNIQATHPFSVFFDFNHESAATKSYVERVNEFWLKEYRFDGYRFDLSKGFTQVNSGNDVAFWGRYDASRIAIWKRIYDQIRKTDPTAYVILEHFADDNEEAELTNYGMMVWDNQNGAVREAVKTGKGNFNRLSWKNHAGFQKPAAIGYMESHDEERIVYDAITNGSAEVKSVGTAIERIKAAAALFFLTPGPKLIWQFGELGYDVSIDQNGRTGAKPIRWEYFRDNKRLQLYNVFSELIRFKTTQAVTKTTDFSLQTTETIKQLILNTPTMKVQVMANFGLTDQVVALPVGRWFDFFSGDEITVTSSLPQYAFRAGQFHVLTSEKVAVSSQNTVSWKIQTITSAEPLPKETALKLSPNPTQDWLNVEWESAYRGEVRMEIVDMTGRALRYFLPQKSTNQMQQRISVKEVPSGTYFLKIGEGAATQTQRWIKQ
ncbi:MAG: T9SS type A sorting domain-containing protein [Bacteroidetes bacterium]|nr:T9SS type A sorting domain-containing protein [Bacteroidota bacterium]